jgi:prepilin-type N-terminal cleavage/methylation domain-containing protein
MQLNRSRQSEGFTLIEILVVIAIISVLSALIFPVFATAKRRAKITEAHAYLRQQLLILEIYSGDSDGQYPPIDVVKADKKMQVPCSPLDTWDNNCWGRPSPMLGSFGYIVPMKDEFTHELFPSGISMPVLCDAFSADYRLGKFDGFFPNIKTCQIDFSCEMPEKLWFAFTDGSIKLERRPAPPTKFGPSTNGKSRMLFTWPSAFIEPRSPAFK